MRRGVSALGLCSWDQFIVTDTYPGPGEYTIVRKEFQQAGGTTGNTCAALARLGVDVLFASVVGADERGHLLRQSLIEAGCDTRHIATRSGSPSDTGIIVISGAPGRRDRTIFWIQGAKPELGDFLPIDDLLEREWFLVDVSDPKLRSFILDLPAHRSPRTALIGTLTYLVEMPEGDGWDHALRHDVIFGNEKELRALTGCTTTSDAVAFAQRAMLGHACRAMYITQGGDGALAVRTTSVEHVPAFEVEVVDTTGAGDAFVAGGISALVERRNDIDVLTRGAATAALACGAFGGRAGQPTMEAVRRLTNHRDSDPR